MYICRKYTMYQYQNAARDQENDVSPCFCQVCSFPSLAPWAAGLVEPLHSCHCWYFDRSRFHQRHAASAAQGLLPGGWGPSPAIAGREPSFLPQNLEKPQEKPVTNFCYCIGFLKKIHLRSQRHSPLRDPKRSQSGISE